MTALGRHRACGRHRRRERPLSVGWARLQVWWATSETGPAILIMIGLTALLTTALIALLIAPGALSAAGAISAVAVIGLFADVHRDETLALPSWAGHARPLDGVIEAGGMRQ